MCQQITFYPLRSINAVSLLSKEDLAEMAESLIYLTYLKRRITFAEESVGGAVDVAIISKGDGFVWIKRKMYFDSKIYCKSIISDIVKSVGTDEIKVTIYDDYESYELSELRHSKSLLQWNAEEQFEEMNKNKSDYADKHFIAAYYGHPDENSTADYSGQLDYYPQANNHYKETEHYQVVDDESPLDD